MAPNQSVQPLAHSDRDLLILATLDGPDALASYFDGKSQPTRPEPQAERATSREPLGAYLKEHRGRGLPRRVADLLGFSSSGSCRCSTAQAASPS